MRRVWMLWLVACGPTEPVEGADPASAVREPVPASEPLESLQESPASPLASSVPATPLAGQAYAGRVKVAIQKGDPRLRHVIAARLGDLEPCLGPPNGQVVEFSVVLGEDRAVTEVSTAFGDDATQACLRKAIQGWSFAGAEVDAGSADVLLGFAGRS